MNTFGVQLLLPSRNRYLGAVSSAFPQQINSCAPLRTTFSRAIGLPTVPARRTSVISVRVAHASRQSTTTPITSSLMPMEGSPYHSALHRKMSSILGTTKSRRYYGPLGDASATRRATQSVNAPPAFRFCLMLQHESANPRNRWILL